MKIEDRILFTEIKNQNKKVFEALFREYYPFLTRFAEGFVFNRQLAEDIVQNLFIYFWENARHLQLDSSIKSYFYQSVKNRCLNHLRDLQVYDRHKLLYIEASLNSEDPSSWEEIDISGQIHEAIESLPPQMKELFLMKYTQGTKTKDIAAAKGISENTVKTQLKRAKDKLREKLFQATSLKFFL
ncbi:RNA polymerase sigma factor [Gaoshiqia sp. Z1-71]|uniref:RNA polymerase sigma factor n=1 Tax=Gaoshiqia hydrogeniformans TaxID=3290090 RepID=UPI003BF82719